MINNRLRKIVTAGVFSSLIIVLGITGLGFIPLPSGAVVIIHVPVIIAAILEGPAVGFFTGLLFGLFSIIQAAMAGVTPVDLAFLNYPWLAIAPRILIGPVAWLVYSLVSGHGIKPKTMDTPKISVEISVVRETLAVILGAALGSLINTVLVLSGFVLILPEIITLPVLLTLVSVNGTVEAGLSAVISVAVILPWKGISRRGKSKLNRDAKNSP